jgi:hypothetical protein
MDELSDKDKLGIWEAVTRGADHMRRQRAFYMKGSGALNRSDAIAPGYVSGVIGDVDTVTVVVVFNETVAAADFTAGVTIKKNTVSQTVNSGTLQGDGRTVYYVIAAAADINDEITWEYSGGNILDAAGNALGNVAAQTAANYIGSQFWFDDLNSSGHFAHI